MPTRKRLSQLAFADADPLWYKDAVIYELHVRAFADANGDGVGDFRGLVGKLDYLQDLGVTALWLLPFYPSPLRDDGYDIADYTDVHPAYGTLADFKAFLREAHARNLRVITELVVNHTSDQHPWFQRARRAKPGSVERDFYVWSDTPNKFQEARIIFKDFEPSNWTWDAVAGQNYWHRFYSHQPDLNYDNPAVMRAVLQVLDFWLDMGIDGFRLDAVPYLVEREGTNCENLPETHACLRAIRRHVDTQYPGRMLLAEANQWPEDAVAYFGQGDECHMAFHFPVMPRLFMAIHMEDRFPIVDILQQTPPIPDACQWAMFLRNHDELTLEMVTDEDRDYMYRTYAQDPQARINLGIRRRLAPLLDNDHSRIELMNGLLLSLPGTPVLYYGDEIGMGDNIYLGDRNGVRTPMQWSADRNAGFSKANPQRLYFPVIIDPEYAYETINVESQQKNLHSLLWYVKRLIALRKRHRAFGRGSMEFLTPENARVLAFVRRHGDECLLVVANLSRFAQFAELDLSKYAGLIPVEMLGRTVFPTVGSGPYFLTLGPHAFYWFSLEAKPTAQEPLPELPTLEVAGKWEALIEGDGKAALEELLPAYLLGCRWYQQRGVLADKATIQEAVPLTYNGVVAYLTLVRVEFADHDDETYLLPLAFAFGDQADHIRTELPHAVVARVRIRERRHSAARIEATQDRRTQPGVGGVGILFDPLGEEMFSQALVHAISTRRRLQRDGDQLLALPLPALKPLLDLGPLPRPALLRTEQTHTSIAFGDRLMLKVYRRIEVGVHPELELGRVFAERTTFRNVPTMAGTLELRPERAEPVALAILEAFVPNQGDAWRYTANALNRYYEHVLTHPGGAENGPPPLRPPNDALTGELPPLAQELIGGTIEDVRQLGRRVAEFHLALASVVDDPAFAPEPFTTLFQRSLYQSFRSQARKVLELLRRRSKDLPEAAREDVQALLAREDEVLAAARKIYETKLTGQRTRGHGDLHLGQILVTGGDLVIIDLEGDARRPLSDRRRKLSPLRDVASLVRSFHYAAFLALERGRIRPEDARALRPWAYAWRFWVSTAFLRAYLEVAGTGSFLPQDPGQRRLVLEFYLMKRAIQELRAELLSDLDRVRIPVEGLLQTLDWHKQQG